MWQSADPALEKYLPDGDEKSFVGMGGIYNPMNLGFYSYARNNPVRLKDPEGDVPIDTVVDAGYVIYDGGRVLGAGAAYVVGVVTGDESLKAHALEGLNETSADLAASTGGLLIPYVPAAVTRGARTGLKIIDKGADAAKARLAANRVAGLAAEAKIAARFPGKVIRTKFGPRVVDVLTNRRIAIESKVGRTGLTKRIKEQIRKDTELLQTKEVKSVEWYFSRSKTTGQIGPTAPLRKALEKAGIKIVD